MTDPARNAPESTDQAAAPAPEVHHDFTNKIVKTFLDTNLSLILILLSALVGMAALWITPREEDPQIVVPMADVFVSAPGHSAQEIEQLVSTPLEKLLYQIDGVEYVYSMSKRDQAIITVRFYVGEDRERSLVKLYKKIDENLDQVPPAVKGWVIKPVEIDDVPIVTLTLTGKTPLPAGSTASGHGPDEYTLKRVAEEMVQRLSAVPNLSRAYVIGGPSRVVEVYLNADRMRAYRVDPLTIQRALQAANVTATAGHFDRLDRVQTVQVGDAFASADEVRQLVVAVYNNQPVFLKDVARVVDGPAETVDYVRHTWGPARALAEAGAAGSVVSGFDEPRTSVSGLQTAPLRSRLVQTPTSTPAVTIAIAKKKGTNAVWVAEDVLKAAAELRTSVMPSDMQMLVTRNYGRTADDKVNELVEALLVAVLTVIALLTISLGWREALIVAVAVPVVFGLTLAVNYLFGFSINRVTLFALILSLGLLVDDPIVDVENIVRHFSVRKKATRHIVLEAVSEIRPPLIAATLAVILSFIPMFFITGMMGPYMRPMALNVPITMLMSMVVAFTITPWLAYHVLRRHYHEEGARSTSGKGQGASGPASAASTLSPSSGTGQGEGSACPLPPAPNPSSADPHDIDAVRQTFLWKLFYPLMAPLLKHRWAAWLFLLTMGGLTVAAAMLAMTRHVPLKMLPFDNKNELLLVLDTDRGTTLERTDAAVRDFEAYLKRVPEVVDLTSYVGLASPMDFNGMVRHYYLRQGPDVAEICINLAPKQDRAMQSHAIGLRLRPDLQAIADRHHLRMKLVETPPGPPVLSTLVAEVYGQPDNSYADLLAAARTVRQRLSREALVVDIDDTHEAPETRLAFIVDKEKPP